MLRHIRTVPNNRLHTPPKAVLNILEKPSFGFVRLKVGRIMDISVLMLLRNYVLRIFYRVSGCFKFENGNHEV